MYDPDAITDSKKYGAYLSRHIDTVLVGYLKDKDPGDLNLEEFLTILEDAQPPQLFSLNKLQKREKF